MTASLEEISKLVKSLTTDNLNKNSESITKWTNYLEEVERTKSILEWLPNKLKYEVMVPLGSKALIKGHLVHTNELLVNLGETWFIKSTAKQAIGICDRRMEKCKVMMGQLDKERQLIIDKSSLPFSEDAFGSDIRPEIIEEVTEEEDAEWRLKHKIRVKEHRKKMNDLRNKEKKPIESQEELWNHLDELELLEELQDELNRMHGDDDDDDDNDDAEEDESTEEENNEVVLSDSEKQAIATEEAEHGLSFKCRQDMSTSNSSSENLQIKLSERRVSFEADTLDSNTEPLRLEFHHSNNEPVKLIGQGIQSPSDIADAYFAMMKGSAPVSILKKSVNPNEEMEVKAVAELERVEEEFNNIMQYRRPVTPGMEFPNVLEHTDLHFSEIPFTSVPGKKISKFKASRMKK